VDIRISAVAEVGRTAEALIEEAAATVLDLVGEHIWASGPTTWSEAIGARLGELGWTLAAVEIGTAGSFVTLLGDAPWIRFDEVVAIDAPAARGDDLLQFARRARELGGADVGVAIRAQERTGDTAVSIAVSTPAIERKDRKVVFLTGPLGRSRSALSAAAFVLETLREAPRPL
jgi:hypothetical protein